jgi:hypothetical protein
MDIVVAPGYNQVHQLNAGMKRKGAMPGTDAKRR